MKVIGTPASRSCSRQIPWPRARSYHTRSAWARSAYKVPQDQHVQGGDADAVDAEAGDLDDHDVAEIHACENRQDRERPGKLEVSEVARGEKRHVHRDTEHGVRNS